MLTSRCVAAALWGAVFFLTISHSVEQDTGARNQSLCDFLRNGTSVRDTIVVTDKDLSQADNDVQFFVDCAMPNDTILFNVKIVEAASTIVVNKPLMLRGTQESGVEFACPPGEAVFNIQ
eukprot:evm.model.scf_20.2 EVM.evm.TU.scf_20.2   scf_20:37719-39722(+)